MPNKLTPERDQRCPMMEPTLRLILNANPSDFILAVQAAKAAMGRNEVSTIIAYENGSVFLVRRTKSGWSVTADNRNSR